KAFLQRGLGLAMERAVQGLVMPHIGRTIDSTVEAINAGLQSLKAGAGTLGKGAVVVDRRPGGGKLRSARERGRRRAASADEDRAGLPGARNARHAKPGRWLRFDLADRSPVQKRFRHCLYPQIRKRIADFRLIQERSNLSY